MGLSLISLPLLGVSSFCVVQSNGGMVTFRSIRELIVGHVSPILKVMHDYR